MPGSDFNGDGIDDLLWRERDTGHVGNWLGTNGFIFTNNSANSLVGVPLQWQIVATGDFNDDGNDDIAWRNIVTNQLGNWFGQDNGGWIINDHILDLVIDQALYAADFDGDGQDELLSISLAQNGRRLISLVDSTAAGDFGFSDPYESVDPAWNVAGIGDFDGDGQDDILWRHSSGAIGNWLTTDQFSALGGVQGNLQSWQVNFASIQNVDNAWQIIGIGDFNKDGRDDILWRHTESSYVGYWLGSTGGTFTVENSSLIQVPDDWTLRAVGDFNGNGYDDLIWRDSGTGVYRAWSFDASGPEGFEPFIVSGNWGLQPNPAGLGEWDY